MNFAISPVVCLVFFVFFFWSPLLAELLLLTLSRPTSLPSWVYPLSRWVPHACHAVAVWTQRLLQLKGSAARTLHSILWEEDAGLCPSQLGMSWKQELLHQHHSLLAGRARLHAFHWHHSGSFSFTVWQQISPPKVTKWVRLTSFSAALGVLAQLLDAFVYSGRELEWKIFHLLVDSGASWSRRGDTGEGYSQECFTWAMAVHWENSPCHSQSFSIIPSPS